MKTVILAGGFGTRMTEVTQSIPKPLVEIGGIPIIWHIMKIYSFYGLNDFVICCGYKGEMIKKFFSNYLLNASDVTFDFGSKTTELHDKKSRPWKVTLVETGLETMTGGRLKRVEKYVGDDRFCLTYGDDLKNVNIRKLIDFHIKKKTMGTVTVMRLPERFGIVKIKKEKITSMEEKPVSEKWINGGYFVFEPEIFDEIEGDSSILEDTLKKLAKRRHLSAYKYSGTYQPMDTLRDKNRLEEMWSTGKAYWKIWH